MATSEVLEKHIEKLKARLKGISQKEGEKVDTAQIRRIKKRLKRTQRKLRTLGRAKDIKAPSKGEPKTQEGT
jgi:hypothetical protein